MWRRFEILTFFPLIESFESWMAIPCQNLVSFSDKFDVILSRYKFHPQLALQPIQTGYKIKEHQNHDEKRGDISISPARLPIRFALIRYHRPYVTIVPNSSHNVPLLSSWRICSVYKFASDSGHVGTHGDASAASWGHVGTTISHIIMYLHICINCAEVPDSEYSIVYLRYTRRFIINASASAWTSICKWPHLANGAQPH